MDSHKKTDAYELMDSQKTDAYKLMDSQKKSHAYKLMDSQKKTDAYELMDSQKIDAYEMTSAQKKNIETYEMTGAQKNDEYEMTGTQKKTHAYKLMDSLKTDVYKLTDAQKIDAYEMTDSQKRCQRKRACQDVDVKPVVRDPMDDDRVLVEPGTEMTLVPHEPYEFEKQKHNLIHIPFQPWCTSCVKGKAQAEPHKRTERIIEDSELPVIQCDYLMLKDTAGTGGLKVLSMYVRTFGYGMSTVVETKGPTDMFATMWAVKMLNFLGLSDIILQCDPEPSLIKWAERVKSKRTERTVIRSSPRRSHQSNGGVENYQKQLQGQVRTMLAAMQEHTKYRPSADNALMRWTVRHAAWLIPRFRGSEIQSHSIVPWEDRIVENWWSLEKQFLHTFQRSEKDLDRQMEIRRVAGKERPHRRARCPIGRWSRVCAKCTTTRREQLVRREPQSSRRDPTEAEVDDNR